MNAVIALNPQQMQESQTTTLGWVEQRIAAAKHELSLAEQVYNSLERNKLRTAPASAQINKARKRIAFYTKVKAALDAGYYIIPPFDVQLFAIRTDRELPSAEYNTHIRPNEETSRSLPVGDGRYVSPVAEREFREKEKRKNNAGNEYEVSLYENTEWRDVEIPVRALKPQVIEATGRALALKIFDALGIAPAYRSADPIIVGQIKRPGSYAGPLTFFVAWWLDESDL